MIHLCGDYYFESDGVHQFTLCKKGVVSGENAKGKPVKAENIGKTKYIPLGYYATIESLLDGLVRKSALEIAAMPDVKTFAEINVRLSKLLDDLTFTLVVDDQTRTVHPKRVKRSS